jgi:hypothetical protein
VDMTNTEVPWKRKNEITLNSWIKLVYRSDQCESLFTNPSISSAKERVHLVEEGKITVLKC